MELKGLKISDIMNFTWDELNKLSPKELKQVTSRLVSASNKRIRRLEKAKMGEWSPAYSKYQRRGSKFSIRGKDINQVKHEFKLTKNFLNMKTSTVTGWTSYRMMMNERTGMATFGESQTWSERTWAKYWKVFRRFEEMHGGTFKKGDSDRILQMITEMFATHDKRKSADTFQQIIEDAYDDLYESEDEDVDEDIDDYFDLD